MLSTCEHPGFSESDSRYAGFPSTRQFYVLCVSGCAVWLEPYRMIHLLVVAELAANLTVNRQHPVSQAAVQALSRGNTNIRRKCDELAYSNRGWRTVHPQQPLGSPA
ncbi:hypothetical protein PSAC2689_30590 [Paraburkholderia sacchari]